MSKRFNSEILNQLINERWNDEGLNIKVEYKDSSRWAGTATIKKLIKVKKGFSYEELADEIIQYIKDCLNQNAGTSPLVTFRKCPDGNYFNAKFVCGSDGKFWKEVYARVTSNMIYAPMTEITFNDGDDWVLDYYRMPY
jgi:hypothetical protein